MQFRLEEMREAKHEDFEKSEHGCKFPDFEKRDREDYQKVVRVPGGWLFIIREYWRGITISSTFVPFPEKYVPVNKEPKQ